MRLGKTFWVLAVLAMAVALPLRAGSQASWQPFSLPSNRPLARAGHSLWRAWRLITAED